MHRYQIYLHVQGSRPWPPFQFWFPGNEAWRSSTSYFIFACLAFKRSEEFFAITASISASSAALSLAGCNGSASSRFGAGKSANAIHAAQLFSCTRHHHVFGWGKSRHGQQQCQIRSLCLLRLSQPRSQGMLQLYTVQYLIRSIGPYPSKNKPKSGSWLPWTSCKVNISKTWN